MLLARIAPEGFAAAGESPDSLRFLHSDPFHTPLSAWELGREVGTEPRFLVPLMPGKIAAVGRSFPDHAAELGNEVPTRPLLFWKPRSSVVGPGEPILLPSESERIEYEGEAGLVIGQRLGSADPEEAVRGILGIVSACDVTARDLQRQDRTFFRAKSFDTFCPLGPTIRCGADLDSVELVTRLNGEERQRGRLTEMSWSAGELVSYVSTYATLEAGDLVLTGTPAGVGPLTAGDEIEVEVTGAGALRNRVARRP